MPVSRRFVLEKTVPLPRAAVWGVLSHTERLNRSIGLAPVTYGDLRREPEGMFRPASAKIAGLTMKWREYPFEWESQSRHSVVRVYERGPFARFEGGIELEDEGANQTLLRVFADIVPQGALGNVLVPALAKRFLNQTLDYCEEVFAGPNNSATTALMPSPVAPKPKARDLNDSLLNRLIQALQERGIAEKYALGLKELLQNAGDDFVTALRPFEWAQERELNRIEALRTCLHGVKIGILNLQWSAMCPNCRVSKAQVASLQNLPTDVHCDVCGVAFDLNFDRYIELKFAVHPAIRRAEANVYCLGGPFRAPHILVQKKIGAGQKQTLLIPALGSDLRIRTLRTNHSLLFEDGTGEVTQLLLTPDGWSDGEKYLPRISYPLGGRIEIENATSEAVWVVIEKTQWDELAATAAQVTAMQEFRDLFSSEILRPGRQVAVENVTLFFSDLSNSTALYERIGDAPAFGRVGSHFDFLSEHIGANGGAVVKTMGDAVMAVFHQPDDALRAALRIQSHFKYFRETLSDASEVDIKIGLHRGPALVVGNGASNGYGLTMDYFGRTVNIAARVAGKSNGGDVIFTRALWEDDKTREIAMESGAKLTSFGARLRGLDEQFDLIRARV